MSARCDFDEQVAVTSADGPQRPDMVVRLAGGKNIVVDSKVSLAAYLEAAESEDEDVRAARMEAHARHLRDHVDRLAGKAYWAALSPSPEFVILFIPGEAFLAPALEHDPGLLEYALARKVHIATPTTLVTMLRTAQYAWQQEALADNARAVFDLGRELYDRIGEPRPARGPPGPRADQGRDHLQPDGRLAGEPGAGHRPAAERPGRRGRRPRAAGAGGGDDPGPVRARADGGGPGGDSATPGSRRWPAAWAWCARVDDADPRADPDQGAGIGPEDRAAPGAAGLGAAHRARGAVCRCLCSASSPS